jgi:hypothetical protein
MDLRSKKAGRYVTAKKHQPKKQQKHDPLFKNILSNQEMFLQLFKNISGLV